MAFTNLSGGGHQTETFEQLHCSARLTGGIHKELIYLSAVNIFLSVTAVLGNTVILVALHKESSLHPPSKLLFSCLATTDLCVGLITEPVAVTRWISMVNGDWNLCRYAFASYLIAGYTLCSVSLLTVTAISVDRLLALLLGLRYRQVITLKRTFVIVVIFWVLSIVAATSFLSGNHFIPLCFGYVFIPLCIVTSIVSYCKIFLTLHHHQTEVQHHSIQQGQPSQTIPLNIARYRKAVSSAL